MHLEYGSSRECIVRRIELRIRTWSTLPVQSAAGRVCGIFGKGTLTTGFSRRSLHSRVEKVGCATQREFVARLIAPCVAQGDGQRVKIRVGAFGRRSGQSAGNGDAGGRLLRRQ